MSEHLVRVEWWDHSSTAIGWEPRERMEGESLDRCVTVGKLIATHPDRLIIASAWVPGREPKEDVSHVGIIARRCVISIRRLFTKGEVMPLKRGNRARGHKAISKNVGTLMKKDNMPHKQAVAVALRLAGKGKKKK